jgi:hypothetical protein
MEVVAIGHKRSPYVNHIVLSNILILNWFELLSSMKDFESTTIDSAGLYETNKIKNKVKNIINKK